MSLLDKFDNIYNTNISSSQVCNMKTGKMPYETYNSKGILTGCYWYYGDTIELNFIIDGEVTAEEVVTDGEELHDKYAEIDDYLLGKNARICIYNSLRYEKVLETVLSASREIKLIIDEETSKKLLRGSYYLTLTIFKDNESLNVPIELTENGQYTILIK